MQALSDIANIRNQVEGFIGDRVQIKANKGRKRVIVKEGYVQETYGCVFVVSVHNRQLDNYRKESYSYTDILTHNVELIPCED